MAGLDVNAYVLRQRTRDLYVFGMDSSTLRRVCYVTPRSEDDPQEVQRLLNKRRVAEIGEYIKQDNSLLPNAIVVSLTDEVRITHTGNANEVTVHFPETEGKFAYVLDGQHRLWGFDRSDGIEFDLPVVALLNADLGLRGKVFADINSKQEKVSDILVLSLYYQLHALPSEEAASMAVVDLLANDTDSPLYRRIRLLDDQKDTWVTNKLIKKCVAPYVESGGVLCGKPAAQQAHVLKEYLKGVKRMWPDAWGENKKHMLTRPMGIEIVMSIFERVSRRCDYNHGRTYTEETFYESLEPLTECKIAMPGGGDVILRWERGDLSAVSNQPGRALIRKQLLKHLIFADEVDT